MTGVPGMYFRRRDQRLEQIAPLGREDRVTITPDHQSRKLRLLQEVLPLWVERDIMLILVAQFDLDAVVPRPVKQRLIENPGVRTFPIRRRLAANTSEAVIEAAIAGAGLARVLSYQIAGAQAEGQLVTLLEPFEPDPVPLSLVYLATRRMPLKLRAFLDYAVPRLQQRLRS